LAPDGGGIMRKKILVKGPVLTRSGYGEQARFALRAIRTRPDLFDLYIQPIDWGHTSWLFEMSEERIWIDNTIEKTIAHIQRGEKFDISLQVTIPNEWEEICPINIGYTAGIETTAVDSQWIMKGNHMDKIVVVSNHSKNVYKETVYTIDSTDFTGATKFQLETEISAVNYPVRRTEINGNIDLNLEYDFNFLCVAQMGPRKNLLNTIKWFVEEFHDDEVGLVVKANRAKNCLMDREWLFNDLRTFLASHKDRKCKIYLLHGDMSDEEINALYCHEKASAFVTLTHGEGFGLPIFEAAYNKMPVIATGWSGQLDFLVDEKKKEHFYNVSFDVQPVPQEAIWEGVITKESMWAYPREQSAKEKMRQCYEDIVSNEEGTIAFEAEQYSDVLAERFSEEKIYADFIEAIKGDDEDFDVEEWLDGLDIQEIE
tara:strand:+ start:10 stop:1293 length:1284 start_codon:yes stop_codon:yes gene_type:complete